jgi:hypothetical protein
MGYFNTATMDQRNWYSSNIRLVMCSCSLRMQKWKAVLTEVRRAAATAMEGLVKIEWQEPRTLK